MSSSGDPISSLGLTCPSGGKFYICQDSKVRFLGCCASDPCADGSGQCPSSDIQAASFDAAQYNLIPPESCADSSSLWYTCQNSHPPFLGCCLTNPCNGGCPASEVMAARLSDDESSAAPFLTSSSSTSTSTSTSTYTSTVSTHSSGTTTRVTGGITSSASSTTGTNQALPTSDQSTSSTPSTQNAPVGAIIGGVVGGVLLLVAIGVFLWWKRRRSHQHELVAQADQMEVTRHPYSPYKDFFASTPTVVNSVRTPKPEDSIYQADLAVVGTPSPSHSAMGSWTSRDSRHVTYSSVGSVDTSREHGNNLQTISELPATEVARRFGHGANGLGIR